MKYFKYLKEHAGWIAIWLFLIISIEIFLLTISGNNALKIYVGVAVTTLIWLGTFIDYCKVKKFVCGLEESMNSLDKKYLFAEMVGAGECQEQELVVYILKEMERSMADNVAEYRRTCEEYKDYIETWVHEVKIPIATAGMIIENHKNDLVGDVGLEAEVKRIQNYVEQALFFARSESVEKDYMIKKIDLEEVVSSVIYDKKRLLREKHAGVDLHDLNTERDVVSDGKWISFVLSQIVDNSIKYAKEAETLALEIWATEENKRVSLHIRDNGVGMKSGELSRIFEKGFTGTNGRNVSASTGMGLYLCKKLCSRLQHELTAKSVEGEGTEMIIKF